MSIMQPPWPYSAVHVLRQINAELARRLNSFPAQGVAPWAIENGQLALSKPGSFRVVWSIQGGPTVPGWQWHGPDMPAPAIATRNCRVEAKIEALNGNISGITDETIKAAEDVIRALAIVWQQKRPADFADVSESWEDFTASPGQSVVVAKFALTVILCVFDDEYLFKTITSTEETVDLVTGFGS